MFDETYLPYAESDPEDSCVGRTYTNGAIHDTERIESLPYRDSRRDTGAHPDECCCRQCVTLH